MMNEFEIGDRVIAIPGFTKKFGHKDYAGLGYIPGIKLIVENALYDDIPGHGNLYFFKNHIGAIYGFALKSIDEVRDEKLKKLGI